MRSLASIDGYLKAFREKGKLHLNVEITGDDHRSSSVRTPALRPGTEIYYNVAQQLVDSQLEHAVSNLLDHEHTQKFAGARTHAGYAVRTGEFWLTWQISPYSTVVQVTGHDDDDRLQLHAAVGSQLQNEYQGADGSTWTYQRPLTEEERQDVQTLLLFITRIGELKHLRVSLDGVELEAPVQRPRRNNPVRTPLPTTPLTWPESDAERLLDEALANGHKVLIDTAYGPWGEKYLGKGNRKTTRGANFGPQRLVQNCADLLATATTTIKKRRALIKDGTLEQARAKLQVDGLPEELPTLHVIVWNPRSHFRDDYIGRYGRVDAGSKVFENARQRILKHSRNIATEGPSVGVFLVFIGDVEPQLLAD